MTDEWTSVGRAVRERREALGLPQGAGGVSVSTWRKVEKAIEPPYRRVTLIAIARALGWPDDAIDRIRAGRPPDELLAEPDQRSIEERVAALEAELAELRTLVGAADRPDPFAHLSPREPATAAGRPRRAG